MTPSGRGCISSAQALLIELENNGGKFHTEMNIYYSRNDNYPGPRSPFCTARSLLRRENFQEKRPETILPGEKNGAQRKPLVWVPG